MKKRILLILVCIFMFSVGSIFIFFKYDYKKEKSDENKQQIIKKEELNKFQEEKETSKNTESEIITEKNENDITNNKTSDVKNNQVIKNKSSKDTTTHNNTTPVESNVNNTPQPEVVVPVEPETPTQNVVETLLTEWEKLGISEYDYYNTPSDNEGELAFKGDTSLCQNEINRLINQYYDSGIDGGNYYTINGKYTHSYLGCGIKIYINGNTYTYNQIKSMGFN